MESGEIELRPLTVILGKNSAGKSSFIRLFPLLKQTLERKISDPLLWYGDYVDFGDFQNTVSKQRANDSIEISFSVMTNSRYYGRYSKSNDKDEFLAKIELSIKEKYIEKVAISFWDQCIILVMDCYGNTKVRINDDERPYEKRELIAFKETGNIIPTILEKAKKDNEQYMARMLEVSDLVSYCKEYIYQDKDKKDAYFYSPFNDDLDISIGSKNDVLSNLKKINPEKFASINVNHKRFQRINNYILGAKLIGIIDRINSAISTDMKQTSYLKPIRAMVNRYYRVQGISIDELDADGSNLPMILKNMSHPELVDFEQWSKEKFGVVFSVTLGEGHISLVIKNDVDGDIMTNVADTGYGYSQMLPIVMLLWMIHSKKNTYRYGKNRTIVIEQPELHLHPAYQAKMIDVFVNIIREAEKNGITIKIIFETHSETMVNRIGTLISEKRIDANKVNVLVFDKINEKTRIESKRFNEEGLLMGWPIGFFSIEED